MEGREAYAGAMREGHVHAWAGRWREASVAYRRAASAVPGDGSALSSLASALAHGGTPGEALDLYEKLSATSPEDSALALRVAELRLRVGRMDEADDAYLRVAEIYRSAEQSEKAESVWRRLIGLSGHRAETMRRVADAAAMAGASEVAAQAKALAGRVVDTPAADETRAAARDAPPSGDDAEPIAHLAARLRTAGQIQPSFRPGGSTSSSVGIGPTAEDDALAAVARDPADLGPARQLGISLRERAAPGADAQLATVADAAEISGDLATAIQALGDRLPIAAEPILIHRRIVRLALLGEAVTIAADAYLAIARHLEDAGDAPAALTEIRRARAVASVDPATQSESARRLRRLGEGREADEADRRAFQLAPRDGTYAVAYAASAARRGAVDELAVALEAIAEEATPTRLESATRTALSELPGETSAVRWARGRLRDAIGDPGAEAELAAAAAAMSPIGPEAAIYLAQRRIARDDANGALDVLRPWLAADARAWGEAADKRRRLAGLALSAADSLNDVETSLAGLRLLVDLDPEDATTAALLAERLASHGQPSDAAAELVRLAERERSAGNLDAAASLIDGALALVPSDGNVLGLAGDLALARGDRDAARARYLLALDGEGGNRSHLFTAAAELSPFGPRVELLRRASTELPDDPEPRRRLVAALMAAGQASQAAAAAAELAELLQSQGDRDGAIAAIDQARKLDPWNAGLAALHDALRGS